MEMEDHHEEQHYGLSSDLRQLQIIMNSPTSMLPPQLTAAEQLILPGHQNLIPPPPPPLATTTTITNSQNYDDEMMMMMIIGGCGDDMMMVPRGPSVSTPPPPFSGGGLEKGEGAGGCIGGEASTGRWPTEETLTLLQIRSHLDSKFKHPNQNCPLPEEASRIMCEEHGYQRSGKKCKEKFENLYKYYKKTKESAATHHQDNNHYYCCDNSIINSSEFDFDDTSISSDHNNNNHNSIDEKRRKNKKRKSSSDYNNWKVKMRDLIDSEMRKVVEKQEEWLEKVVKIFEEKENERILREEIWRKEEEIRFENEHKFWAMKREWIEARDSVLMDALKKLKGITRVNNNNNGNGSDFSSWHGSDEITRIQQQSLCFEEEEEVVANSRSMACFGYERSSNAFMCREKWESVINNNNDEAIEGKGNTKKQKGKSRSNFLCFDDNIAQ